MPGAPGLILVLVVLLLLFGARKLPELGRSMGRSTRIFKAEAHEGDRDQGQRPSVAEDNAQDGQQSSR